MPYLRFLCASHSCVRWQMGSSARKKAALVAVGVLTLAYSLVELLAALYYASLTLLSDAFHNLSDVLALALAYWALHVCPFPFVV